MGDLEFQHKLLNGEIKFYIEPERFGESRILPGKDEYELIDQ